MLWDPITKVVQSIDRQFPKVCVDERGDKVMLSNNVLSSSFAEVLPLLSILLLIVFHLNHFNQTVHDKESFYSLFSERHLRVVCSEASLV